MINELIGRVFAARNIAHLQHFTTASYAEHQALGEFYERVIEYLDTLVEAWRGQFGKLGVVELPAPEVEDIVDYLREEADWIEANREAISHESAAVGNLVDTLVAVYLKAIYQLENLR